MNAAASCLQLHSLCFKNYHKNMKRNSILYSTIVLLATTASTAAMAQTTGEGKKSFSPKMLVYENLQNENVLRHFNERFNQLDTLLSNPKKVSIPVIDLTYNDQETKTLKNTDSLYLAKTVHEQLALKRHHGLEVTGQVYVRPSVNLNFDSEEDDAQAVSRYKAKVQAEIGWNIINSKFYQGKAKKKKIALANELDRLQERKRQTTDVYEKAADELTEQYNYYIGATIAHRLANLDIMNEAYQFMLEKDRISNDKMLKVMNDKLEAEYDLSVICASKDIQGKPIYKMTPTRIDIDTTALWSYLNDESIEAQILQVKEQIADNQSKLTNYLATTRLTPFARWSSYLTSSNSISNNADLGVRFTIPLWNESPRQRKALETEKEILRNSRGTEVKTIRQACDILIKKIENLNQAIATEAFHISQTGKYVAMRRNAYINQEKGYNYLMRMEEYTGLLQSMERMYRLMLNRGLAIIQIEKATGIKDGKSVFKEKAL